MQDPLETSELLAFTKTVEAQSLSRAAAELGVPRATISRRLARLEERLSARLLRRTTRSLVLTDAGDALYRHARIVLDAVAQAEGSVRRADHAVRGDLRVSAPLMLNDAFLSMISGFAKRYPEVRLHVHLSSQHVDLQRGGYDAAIRATTELEPGLVARTLLRSVLVAVASPEYLAAHGVPKSARELKDHRCLLGFVRGELPQTHWPLVGGGKIPVTGAFLSNEMAVLCDAALRGLGIALVPTLLAKSYIEEGLLVEVLSGEVGAETRVFIVYLEREFIPPQLRAFIDTVVEWSSGEADRMLPQRLGPSRESHTPKQPAKKTSVPPAKARSRERTKPKSRRRTR
ncbi:MAG: LysR family transcriptional regulator [Myxococcota bacterium]